MTKVSELTIKKKNPKRFELLASSQFNVVALGAVVLALSVVGYFLVVRTLGASTSLYLAPPSIAVSPGESLVVAVRLSTPEQVKIVRANLKYPADKFDYVGINSTGSAFPTDAGVKGGGGDITVTRTAPSGSTVTGDELVFKINLKAKSTVGVGSVTFVTGSAVIRSSDNVNVLAGTSSGTYAVSAQAGPISSNTTTNTKPSSTTAPTTADGSVSDPAALDATSGSGDGLAVEPTKAKTSVLVWILIGLGAAVGLAGLVWISLKFVLPWLKNRRSGAVAVDYNFMGAAASPAATPVNIGVAPIAPVGVGQSQSIVNPTPQPSLPSQPAVWQPNIATIAPQAAPMPAISQPMPSAIPPNPPFTAAPPQPMVNVVQPAVAVTPNSSIPPVAANIAQPQPGPQPAQIVAEPLKVAPMSGPVGVQPSNQSQTQPPIPAPTQSSPIAPVAPPAVPPTTI